MPDPINPDPCPHCNSGTPEFRVTVGETCNRTELWCAVCYDEETIVCDHCGDRVSTESAQEFRGDMWCNRCVNNNATECQVCHTMTHNDHISEVTHSFRRGRLVCEDCSNANGYFTCDSCGDFCHPDVYGGDGYCTNCTNDDDDDDDSYSSGIGDYHSTRRRGFAPIEFPYPYSRRSPAYYAGRHAPKLLFGLELEIERGIGPSALTPSQIAAKAKQQLGSLFAGGERDGSLRDGVEIITHPATIDAHRAAWSRFDLRGSRAVSHDAPGGTCGLHIHFTRAAVSQLTIAKIVQLFGDPSSTATWSRMFRRNLNRYSETCLKHKLAAGSRQSANRYECVNTTGSSTVEVRWPKGTLQARTVVATLEIVHAAIRYCERASMRHLNAGAFLQWICRDPWARSETRTARRYLIDRGLVGLNLDVSARVRPGVASLPSALADDAAPIPDATPMRSGGDAFAASAAASVAAYDRRQRMTQARRIDPVSGIAPPLPT